MGARDLATATPQTRDRYVDFLRVAALGCVMLGHFFMAGVVRGEAGEPVVGNSLVDIPLARWLTWLFQVLPVFFMVGGFSHAVAIASLRRRTGDELWYADFAVMRCRRLLEPTLAFVTFGVVIGAVVEVVGRPTGALEFVLRLIGQPLWFVGIYLIVVALAPAMLRLHERFDVVVVVVLAVAVAVIDVVHLAGNLALVGYLNFVAVWLTVHQLGFFYADGRIIKRRVATLMAVGGFSVALVLVWLFPYPVSMVSLPGERVSNLAPPSLALLALAVGQIGLLMLVRDPLSRWLGRPRVWLLVVAANGVVMTAFLWHLTAIVSVNAWWVKSGLPTPPIGSAQWWLLRPVLLALVVVVLGVLIAVFRRFELPQRATPAAPKLRRPHRSGLAAIGLAMTVIAILGFSITGFSGVTTWQTQTLIVVPVTPLINLLLLLVGWRIVQWAATDLQPTPT